MSTRPNPFSADEIDAIASDWTIRREAGLSAAEAAEFERWRAADPRHEAALNRLAQVWAMLARPRHAGRGHEMARALAARARRRRRRATLGVVVAAAGIFVGAFSWQAARAPHATAPETAQLVRPEKQILPDGGTVELKPGAEISVDYTGEWRRVVLRHGEALFHVAENKARPFVVTAGGVDVRAVGTAFLVSMDAREVDVVVTHGVVAVERPLSAETASSDQNETAPAPAPRFATLVEAGSRVTIDVTPTPAAPAVMAVSAAEMKERLAWCGPRVEFNDTALGDAVALMNRHSKLQLVIDDARLARLPVNGLFRVDNTETLVRLLESSFGVRAERSGDTITLRQAR